MKGRLVLLTLLLGFICSSLQQAVDLDVLSGKGEGTGMCFPLKHVITSSITIAVTSFYADHQKSNRTFQPNIVDVYSYDAPSVLFRHYHGQEASAAELYKAIFQVMYSAAEYGFKGIRPNDRNTLRRNLYRYISAGSHEYARKKAAQLFVHIINDYAKDSSGWRESLCVDSNIREEVFEAIEVELLRIRNEVGDVAFGQFLSLAVGSTLAFAIDDTGSMSAEIRAATERAQKIVQFTRGTLDAPQDFVLVPFNDPEVGPVTVTTDAEVYHEALASLRAHGGGDAPEMAMRGIQLAIENSRPGSIVYVISDINAKDYKLQDTVIAQAREKTIVVTFLLTNRINNCPDDRTYKRCMNLYEYIAQQTGGKILVINRRNIFRATDIVQSYAKQGLLLLKAIKLEYNGTSGRQEGRQVEFFVDSTIQELVLETQGRCSDSATVTGPNRTGTMKLKHQQRYSDIWTTSVKVHSNQHSGPGLWSVNVNLSSGGSCSVKVQGKSTMGFVLTLFKKRKGEPDSQNRILENYPTVGDDVSFAVDIYGIGPDDKVKHLKLVTETGKVLESSEIEFFGIYSVFRNLKDGINEMEPFYVSVEGVDARGYRFQRMQPRVITSSHVHIKCDLSKIIFRAGEESKVNVTLHNYGPDDTLVVTTSDGFGASSFHSASKSKKVTIGTNEKATKTLYLKVDEKTTDGTAIKITITAKGQHEGSFQYSSCTVVVGQKKRPRIDAFSVQGTINARLAETVVTSVVINNADVAREAEFDILLPKDSFITGITIKLPNETIHGTIEEKKKAKKVYDKAKEIGTVAGHVAARDSSTRAYRTSMLVEPRQTVQFVLTYQQVLRRVRGRYEYAVVLNPDQPIHRLTVDVNIVEEDRLLYVRVPQMKTTLTNVLGSGLLKGTKITMSRRDTAAHVHYEPSLEDQTKYSPNGLAGTFVIEYDVMRPDLFGQVSVNNGYFAHFFAPPNLPPTPKIVVFVLDTSGSMYGIKMKQMKEAMLSVLSELNQEDRFNLVMFGDKAEPWMKNFMTHASPASVEDAKQFVRAAEPIGGTNVAEALDVALELLKPYLPALQVESSGESVNISEGNTTTTTGPVPIIDPSEDGFLPILEPEPVTELRKETVLERLTRSAAELDSAMDNYAKMVVLLTDGRPSVGETDTQKIIKQVTENNMERFSLHTLGFGSLVDFDFLTKLAALNLGDSRRVFENMDAQIQIKNFLDEVTKPVLRDVTIDYPSERVTDLTINTFNVFMDGTELLVAGQMNPFDVDDLGGGDSDSTLNRAPRTINAQVRGRSYENELEVDFDIDPMDESKITESPNQISNFTEKLWAFLKLKEILLQAKLEKDKDKKGLLNQKALNMSLKYELVTPLTSLVVLRSEERERIEETLEKEAEEARIREEEREREKARERDASERSRELSRGEEGIPLDSSFPDYLPPRDSEEEDGFFLMDYEEPIIEMNGGVLRAPPRVSFERERLFGGRGPARRKGGGFSGDPHFVVPIQPEMNLCFNWDGKEGEIYNFLFDPEKDLTINGVLANTPAPAYSGRDFRTYVSTISFVLPTLHTKLLISPWNVTIIQRGAANFTIPATSTVSMRSQSGVSVAIGEVTPVSSVAIIKCHGLVFSVIMHRGRRSKYQRDHLDLSLDENLGAVHPLSDGVYGQFARLYSEDLPKLELFEKQGAGEEQQERAYIYISGNIVKVVKHSLRMPGTQETEDCWYIHKNGDDVMRKRHDEFRMTSIFDIPPIK